MHHDSMPSRDIKACVILLVTEAHTAVLIRKSSVIKRNDLDMWLLKHTFQPVSTREYGDFQLLYLSSCVKSTRDSSLQQRKESKMLCSMIQKTEGCISNVPSIVSPTPHHANTAPEPLLPLDETHSPPTPQKMYIITPKTRIISVAQAYRKVFILDLSSSLATIDTGTSHVMIGNAYTVLERMLNGLVQSFSLCSYQGSSLMFEPLLHLTVIAECSQFGSNMNVIPILAEYPTMRVLIQDTCVTRHNISRVLETLQESIQIFQHDLGIFRKELKKRRSKLGYTLDVRTDHSFVVEEGVSTDFEVNTLDPLYINNLGPLEKEVSKKNDKKKNDKKSVKLNSKTVPSRLNQVHRQESSTASTARHVQPTHQNAPHHSTFHHHRTNSMSVNVQRSIKSIAGEKKDVWGVGKSGSSLAYILRAGLLALNLQPLGGKPSIVLITDGVVKSNLQDESILQQLSSEDIACNIVQMGSKNVFAPGCNFGFVADNEILTFVAKATGGQFMYAEQCPSYFFGNGTGDFSIPSSVHSSRRESCSEMLSPNMYHINFLIKEICLDRIRLENKGMNGSGRVNDLPFDLSRDSLSHGVPDFSIDNRAQSYDEQGNRTMASSIAFPWDPYSQPSVVEKKLLKYQEYYLPTEFWHVFSARIRQGFCLSSIVFDDNRSRRTANAPEDILSKKERVMITLVLNWHPNITIEYRIRANWSSTWSKYLKGTSPLHENSLPTVLLEDELTLDEEGMLNCMKAPKVEILIRANSSFAHMLQNWEVFQRRSQMMGIVTGSIGIGDFSGSPIFLKVGQLKKLLIRISETDAMLKTLVSINSPYSQGTIYQQQSEFIKQFETIWDNINDSEFRPFSRYWYDEHCFDIIVDYSISYKSTYKMVDESNDFMTNTLLQLNKKLSAWMTITKKDSVYIKILNLEKMWQEETSAPTNIYTDLLQTSVKLNSGPRLANKYMQFCEVRICRDKDRIISVRLLFFNTSISRREEVIEEVKRMLIIHPVEQESTMRELEVKSAATPDSDENQLVSVKIIHRPISLLLMRDAEHYMASAEQIENQQTQINKMWYINSTFWLTGEFLVRNYLYHRAWHWEVEDYQTDIYVQNKLMGLQALAFDYLCKARLSQSYIIVSSQHLSCHFYKEVKIGSSLSAIQYYIWRNVANKKIITELWIEPVSVDPTYTIDETIMFDVYCKDKEIMTQLVTFDHINTLGRDPSLKDTIENVVCENSMDEVSQALRIHQTNMLDISSVLRLGTFLLASYPCPKYNNHCLVQESEETLYTPNTTPSVLKPGDSERSIEDLSTSRHSDRSGVRSRYSSKLSSASSFVGGIQTVWQSDRKLTCSCPRPDRLFCQHKEVISRLTPVYRDMALLHYYVEKSLFSIADNDMLLYMTPIDDFWSTFIQSLHKKDQQNATSTLDIVRSLRDMRCFVKCSDPSVFVVVLIPCLNAVVERLSELQNEDEMFSYSTPPQDSKAVKFDFMSLLVFECHRQNPESDESDMSNLQKSLSQKDMEIKTTETLLSEEWLNSLGTTLSPHLLSGCLGNLFINSALSDRTLRLMQDITRVYSRSFVKSVFTCFLHGRAVEEDDFEKVLEICDESTLDIDLTGYLNVQTLLKRRGRTNLEELESAHQRFVSVLGHYFEPVILTTGKRQNIYCYRPPFAKVGQKLGFSLSGEKPSNLADVVECAQNPLFVRLEYTLRKPKSTGGFMEVSFPLEHLPSSYEGVTDSGEICNYEPASIGSISSPIDSGDKTIATLHLACMTLPQVDHDPVNVIFSHVNGCTGDASTQHQSKSFLETNSSHRASLSSLTRDKQDALVETEARLNWLFTEEIMHGLLRSGPITQSVIRYIEAQLMKKNPFVDFPTTMFMPLVFAKNQYLSRQVFFEELEKNQSTPYRLIRVGDCFYASDKGPLNMARAPKEDEISQDGSELFKDEGLNISVDKISHSSKEQNESDEFCHGLGISISEPDAPEEYDEVDSDSLSDPMRQQLYWLLLIPQIHSVQIYFYSKLQQSVNRSEIIRVTKTMVNEVLDRTNKIVLLQCMHETRTCSKYLLVPDSTSSKQQYSSDDFSDDDGSTGRSGSRDNLVEILSTSGEETTFTPPKKFQPGQFGCDILYTKLFPLYWRLQPNSALNTLANDVMQPFAVKNRPNMFVCMRDNIVVYCFLSETTSTHYIHDSDLSLEPDNPIIARPSSPYGSLIPLVNNDALSSSHTRNQHISFTQGKLSPPGSISSEKMSLKTSSPGKQDSNLSPNAKRGLKSYETRELVLEVHGVELPTWISEELVDMLENRLTTQITLKEVQQFLTRNPTSKLSRADIEFILPIEKAPTGSHIVRIPDLIANPIHFLNTVRQNLLAGPLRVISGSDLHYIFKRHCILRYGGSSNFTNWQARDSKNDADSIDPTSGEFCFYYSCSSRTPGICTPFELSVGQGVAGIIMCLLDSKCTPTSYLPNKEDTTKNLDSTTLHSCLEDKLIDDLETKSEYKLGITIWTVGQINAEYLFEHVYSCLKQSICDYIVERSITLVSQDSSIVERRADMNLSEDNYSIQTIIQPFCNVLENAIEWKSPTVKEFSRSASLAPWCIEDILLHLDSELTEQHMLLKPTVARATLSSDLYETNKIIGEYEACDLYSPTLFMNREQRNTSQNYRYLLISGIPELNRVVSSSSIPTRRQSVDSERSQKTYFRPSLGRGMVDDESLRKEAILRRDDLSVNSRHDSMASGASKSNPMLFSKHKNGYKDLPYRHCFLMILIDVNTVKAYAYNCTDTFSDQFYHTLSRILIQKESRVSVLNNVLHQKMGLFHHTVTVSNILTNSEKLTASIVSVPTTPHHQYHRASMSPGIANIARLAQMDPQSRSASSSSLPQLHMEEIPEKADVSFGSLKQLITNTFSARNLTGNDRRGQASCDVDYETSPSIYDVQDVSKPHKLPKSETMDTVYMAVRIADVNAVLRDHYAESTANYEHARNRDYLIRHGEPFLNLYLRRSQIQAAHTKAFKVYTKWADRYSNGAKPKELEMMTAAELKTILKSSRLLHFCRTPLFIGNGVSFETENIDMINPQLFGEITQSKTADITAWFEKMAQCFMTEYSAYLEGIGMHLIVNGPLNSQSEELETCLSRFKSSDTYTVLSPVIYLLQVFQGGTIMCEARLTDGFAFVTLYTLHRRYGRFTQSPYTHERNEIRSASFKAFTEECGRVKQRIHVSSFVFDFHLRYLQKCLDAIDKIPSSVDIMSIIQSAVSVYEKPTRYARNRVMHGVYELDTVNGMANLLPSILRSASQLGLRPLNLDKKLVACFSSSNDLSFDDDHNLSTSTQSAFRYTLIISAVDALSSRSTNSKPITVDRAGSLNSTRHMSVENKDIAFENTVLHYYILVVYREMDNASDATDKGSSWSKVLREKSNYSSDSLNEVMQPTNHTLGDIVEQAKRKIDTLVKKAIIACHRDEDWSKIYRAVNMKRNHENHQELIRLSQGFDSLTLEDVDLSFGKFLKLNLRWDDVLNTLKKFYPMIAGEFQVQNTRHLLLFMPNAVMNYFVHFEYQADTKSISVRTNSKESRKKEGKLDEIEKTFVIHLANTLSYYTWKNTH
ncbi:hypothetical protein BDF14DRAFT_1880142 [Spinellus fusiger]|nr:hypothetical protein BDF14DRAFT_1880142 [Spinellus fusiger]